MPLRVPPVPAPARRSVRAALTSAASRGIRLPDALDPARDRLRPELPLPVHEMTGVRGGTSRPATRLTGWRYLLRDSAPETGVGTLGAAEAMLTPDGWAFGFFADGPYVRSTELALTRADHLPGLHQPLLLGVPELYMVTLWLRADAGADPLSGSPAAEDLLMPLAPAPPGIAAYHPYRADALLHLLTRRLVPALARGEGVEPEQRTSPAPL